MIFVSLWHTSPNMIISSPCMSLQITLFHSLLSLSSILLCVCMCVCVCVCVCVCMCMYLIFLIHSSANVHFGCFHELIFVNNVATNIGMHVPFQIRVFYGRTPVSGIAGSHGNSIFSFSGTLHTAFHSAYVSLHSF